MIYLGMDVHKDSIMIAVLPQSAKTPMRLEKLANDLPERKKWLERIAHEGEIHACYEASGAGYVLRCALVEWGYACDVIAPSLIPKRSGVHRKRDNWCTPHLNWLQHLTTEASPLATEDRLIYRKYRALLVYTLQRREELDRQIERLAELPRSRGISSR